MIFIKKTVAHAVVGRVTLVDAAIGLALTFRSVVRVVARDNTRNKHGRLTAISGAGGEQAKGDDEGENQVLHKNGVDG